MESMIVGKGKCSLQEVYRILKSSKALRLFHDKWSDFARELGMGSDKIKRIRDDRLLSKITLTDAIWEIVEEWMTRRSKDATLKELVKVLESIGMGSCGEALLEHFIPSSISPKPFESDSWREFIVDSDECPITTVESVIRPHLAIHENWSILASHLDVPSEQLKQLRDDSLVNKITYADILRQVLEAWVGRKGKYAELEALINVVEDKLGADGVGESLRLQFNWPCRMPDYDSPSISWQDLSPDFQRRVRANLHTFFPSLRYEQCLPNMNGIILFDLMIGKQPRLFNHKLPKELTYYVHRTLLTRNIISAKIFENNSVPGVVFLFTGIERHQLSVLAKDTMTSSSSEQLRDITVQFMILDQPNHFEVICGNTSQPVHWLNQETNGKLKWVKSRGAMTGLHPFVESSQDNLSEEDFIATLSPNSNLSICISDTPGMGKSVLLAQIGSKLANLYPERAVIFIILSEFVNYVKKISITIKAKKQAIEKALQDLTCDNDLGRLVLRSKFGPQKSEEKITFELLLDGLDEVDSDDYTLTLEILQIIKNSFKFGRLWVTSRPHLLEELENNLNVLGYNMLPFDPHDQLRFLTKYWSFQSRDKVLDQIMLKNFAQYCLTALKRNIKSEDEDIAGIPLQCLLIGEVYEDEAIAYTTSELSSSSSSSPIHSNILVSSITDLYNLLITKKFEKYLTVPGYVKQDFAGKDRLMNMHIGLSVKLLFPDYFDKLRNLFQLEEIEPMLQIGIVESADNSISATLPRFIHRTFAEYFIAWFVVNRLNNGWGWWRKLRESFPLPVLGKESWTKELTHFLIHRVLSCQKLELPPNRISYNFRHHIISYFINSLITDLTTLPIHSRSHFNEAFNTRDVVKLLVHSCNNANFLQIFNFFDGLHAFDKHGSRIFDPNFVLYSTQYSSLKLLNLTFAHFERHHQFNQDLQREALTVAVRRAEFSIVEFLLKIKQLKKSLGLWPRTLIHLGIEQSKDDSVVKLDQKRAILGMLAGFNRSLLETFDKVHRTPILVDNVHVQLLLEVINWGGNVLSRDLWNDTVLHLNLGRRHLSREDYHSLVMAISLELLGKLVKVKGRSGESPLISLIHFMGDDPDPETLERFKEANCDFNTVDDEGYSVLAVGIRHKRNPTVIRKLIDIGGNVEWKGRNLKSLLHVAAESRNVDAVIYLVEEYDIKVNVTDADDFTPLDRAIEGVRRGKRFESETIMALHDRGGAIKGIVNSYGQSWLHVAAQEGNFDLVYLLLKDMKKLELISGTDTNGNTPLHLGVAEGRSKYNCYDITKLLLLDYNADPNALNKEKETAFHLALRNKQLDIATFKLLKSKTDVEWSSSLTSLALEFLKRNAKYMDEDEFMLLLQEFGGNVPSPSGYFQSDPRSKFFSPSHFRFTDEI